MTTISLQVIQGLERGQAYSPVPVPLTIGREEDNAIQLNDERISRCHVKIQQDGSRIILTDLQSTNGTRVNGLPIQMTVLRPGDLITLGRCVLLYGSEQEIQEHCDELHKQSLESHRLIDGGNTFSDLEESSESGHDVPEIDTIGLFDDHGFPAASFPGGCPPLPETKSLHQRSELADLLSYLHSRLLRVLESRGIHETTGDEDSAKPAQIPWDQWRDLLSLEVDLAKYLREISEPE